MMQVTKVWRDGEKLMAEPIDPASVYKDPVDGLLDEAKVLADDRPVEVGHLPQWALDAEHMIRRLVKAFNSTPQPARQEPFGYFKAEPFGWTDCAETDEGAVALYEHSRTWVGLTIDELDEIWGWEATTEEAMRAVEAKLKERNT